MIPPASVVCNFHFNRLPPLGQIDANPKFIYLFGKQLHADGASGKDVSPTDDWTDDAAEGRFEGKVFFECHIEEYGIFSFLLLE